jgi:hypothetical protein
MAGKPKAGVNWIAIEAEFRAGIKTIEGIAAAHGITDAAIRKKAKLNGWERNLTERIQMAVAEKVARTAAAEGEDVIEANANAIVVVELGQRADIKALRELVGLLTLECQAQVKDVQLFKDLGELMARPDEDGAPDKLNEIYRKVVSMPGRISAVKQLAETLKILIELERKVLKMDADTKEKGSGIEDLLRKIGKGA